MNSSKGLRSRASECRRFQGFNLWAVSLNLLLLGTLLVIALRVVPGYVEYLTVKDVITRAAQEHDPRDQAVTDLKMRLAKLLNTNQVYDLSVDNIKVYRERGVIVIDARYEKRFPLFWILDGVMNFDDLVVETTQADRT